MPSLKILSILLGLSIAGTISFYWKRRRLFFVMLLDKFEFTYGVPAGGGRAPTR